jgi:CelD/BcsL family acetyltransferase involved in cellulose biosynthesis
MRNAQPLAEPAQAVEISVHRGDLAPLAPDWEALVEPAHPGAAFRSWAWSSSWWKTFSAGRDPFVLLARQNGATVGLLPLCSARSPLGGRRLGFFGEGIVGSDYLGVVCRGADEPRLAHAFAAALARQPFDELDLDGLVDGDPLRQALQALLPAARVAMTPRYRCPHVALDGTFDRYLASLPDGTGAQWKRRLRWLEKRPGFALERHDDATAIATGLDALFALHQKRWALEGGSDAIDGPATERFHRVAARALAERGWARLYLLHADGAPRAALYGFRHGDRFAFYQAGYDPEWRQRSVGTVLLGHIVRDCFAERVREFDFLRGTESYKLKWANGWRETVRLRARDASWRALVHDAGRNGYWRLREAAKRMLPPSTLAWARRARKAVTR